MYVLEFLLTKIDNSDVISFLREALGRRGPGRIRRSLRYAYYDFVSRRTKEPTKQNIPCMAGIASCHITEKGYLTSCCTRWTAKGFIGNLRQADYDIRKLWFTAAANKVRQSIKRQECACPLASAAYSSLLAHPRSLLKIAERSLLEDLVMRH